MAAMTASSMTAALNELTGDRLIEGLNKQVPAVGLATKKDILEGDGKALIVQYGVGGGQSATFANAVANISDPVMARLLVTRVKEYAAYSIETEAIRASRSNKGAVASLLRVAVDSANLAISRSIGIQMYRGGGYRAVCGTVTAGPPQTLALASEADAALFTPGMKIVADTAADGTGTRRANALTVSKVDVAGKLLTVTGTITGWAANDYIARDGDFGATFSGFGAWIPATTPGTLFGFDRSVAPDFLGGQRFTNTSGAISDILIDVASKIAILGGQPDIVLMNPINWATLVKEVGAKDLVRSQVQGTLMRGRPGVVGYDALGIFAGVGRLDVIADPNCPVGRCFVGKRSTMEFWTLGPMIGPVTDLFNDGRIIESSADAITGRLGGYFNFVITEPWHWANVGLPA